LGVPEQKCLDIFALGLRPPYAQKAM
jgi:hypothetical protein